MIKLKITGLNKGKIEEFIIKEDGFDRDALSDELAELTFQLIDKKLLSDKRRVDPNVKIYLVFGDDQLLLCHFSGRMLCDLTTELLNNKDLVKFDFLEGNYFDAYDLIQDVVEKSENNRRNTFLDELNALLDEINYEDGAYYKGDIENGSPHGFGLMKWANGSTYEGNWVNAQITGVGVFNWIDGSSYSGEFLNGLMHGKGKHISSTGVICEGIFSQGKIANI
jgi:hypothetical protein